MTKSDLIEALKTEAELIKNEASAVVNLFFDQMSEALASGDRVEIRGLCSFHVKKYDSYTGRNPKTGNMDFEVIGEVIMLPHIRRHDKTIQ
jgi:integration host factor subunit beta